MRMTMREVLPAAAIVLTAPAITVLVRRGYLFATGRGTHLGSDVVIAAYSTAVFAFVLSLLSRRRSNSRLARLAVPFTAIILATLAVAHATGVFVPVW